MQLLETLLKSFCEYSTLGRDPSHGVKHMQRVVQNTKVLAVKCKMKEKDADLAIICAWLHDIADHKYKFPKVKVSNFLDSILEPAEAKLASNIIDRISFSREEKEGKADWEEVLGIRGILIRNVVSDADKLESLGKIGFIRCVQFTKHKWRESTKDLSGQIPDSELQKRVFAHCNEKLFSLTSKFYTKPGRDRSVILTKKLIDLVAKLKT